MGDKQNNAAGGRSIPVFSRKHPFNLSKKMFSSKKAEKSVSDEKDNAPPVAPRSLGANDSAGGAGSQSNSSSNSSLTAELKMQAGAGAGVKRGAAAGIAKSKKTAAGQGDMSTKKKNGSTSSLASSASSFASGLRGPNPKQSPAKSKFKRAFTPGWKSSSKVKLRTPKSILKQSRTFEPRTTGHKLKALKDKTNIESNRFKVSMKLDFTEANKRKKPRLSDEADPIFSKTNSEDIDSVTDWTSPSLMSDDQDTSVLSGLQNLSLNNSDSLPVVSPISPINKENQRPKIPDSKPVTGEKTEPLKTKRKAEVLEQKNVQQKERKPISRSATFTSGASSKRNRSATTNGSHTGASNAASRNGFTGVRRYSELKQAEEDLLKKNAILDAKLRNLEDQTSSRIYSLETVLSESRGKLDELDHENFELREQLELKEKYFTETLEKKDRLYMEENKMLKERVDRCVGKLIECGFDPVTLEPMKLEQSQEERKELVKARMEAKVQCKILHQKLTMFIQRSQEQMEILESNDFEIEDHGPGNRCSTKPDTEKTTVVQDSHPRNIPEVDNEQTLVPEGGKTGTVLT